MTRSSLEQASGYVYEHVSSQVLIDDLSFRDGAPAPGDRLPTFDLPGVDGSRIASDEILAREPMLLITGSLTCPMTASSNPKLKRLHARFGDDVAFVMLHVREAHPGERHDQPGSLEEKIRHARALKRRDGLPWPIAVDTPDGGYHRRLDEKPNAAYLVDRGGRIVYRSLWAADDEGLAEAMDCLLHGEPLPQSQSTRRIGPMADGIAEMYDMIRRSGPRAQSDMWRAAPPMAAMAWLADLYRPLPARVRVAAAAATIGAGAALAAGIVTKLARRR